MAQSRLSEQEAKIDREELLKRMEESVAQGQLSNRCSRQALASALMAPILK